MKKGLIIAAAILIPILLIAFLFIGTYNGLVSEDVKVQNAFANIDVQLQRRNDLIPNLVSTVKGYATHEEEIFTAVADARAKLAGATDINGKVEANNELTSSLSRLIAIAENYPDLKASENFLSLQDELAGTENRIAVSRKDYNDAVMAFNAKIRTFPTNVLAGMFGFHEYVSFEASDGASTPPVVDFTSK